MANPDRARKLLIRSALVTSSTIATFIGAQNLAMLDTRQFGVTQTPAPEAAVILPLPDGSAVTAPPVQQVAPALMIRKAAPSIIVLRQSQPQAVTNPSSVGQSPVQASTSLIQPPAPAQIAAPAPVIVQQPGAVIVQQPVPQSSRSTR